MQETFLYAILEILFKNKSLIKIKDLFLNKIYCEAN